MIMSSRKILVTGGAGYLGSHAALQLLNSGYQVLVLDNLSNSSIESLNRVAKLTGQNPIFIEGDIRNRLLLDEIFSDHSIYAVMHFAGIKSVSESISNPLQYYDNNVYGSIQLFLAMSAAGVCNLIFSSSATVYGEPENVPIKEDYILRNPLNPYGRSKLIIEGVLKDLAISDSRWHIAILRYFNPVGAHESGYIGEDPSGTPGNLLPYITSVAIGNMTELPVFGNDYPTHDGTGIRDYIHVLDLIDGHLRALERLEDFQGSNVWNLGSGQGYSVLEVIRSFEKVSGKKIPRKFYPRRYGDVAACFADCSKAEAELGWRASRDLNKMIYDAWKWQLLNPRGYKG